MSIARILPIRQRRFRQPITELVNGTFGVLPQVRLVFGEETPQLPGRNRNFVDP
jgi:hypothetical protein